MCTSQLTELFEIGSYSNNGLNSRSSSKLIKVFASRTCSGSCLLYFSLKTVSYCDKNSSARTLDSFVNFLIMFTFLTINKVVKWALLAVLIFEKVN